MEDLLLLGSDLQDRLSSSGLQNVSLKIENLHGLKENLNTGISDKLGELDVKLQAWQRFTSQQESFEALLQVYENQLNEIETTIDLETPNKLKVLFFVCFCIHFFLQVNFYKHFYQHISITFGSPGAISIIEFIVMWLI